MKIILLCLSMIRCVCIAAHLIVKSWHCLHVSVFVHQVIDIMFHDSMVVLRTVDIMSGVVMYGLNARGSGLMYGWNDRGNGLRVACSSVSVCLRLFV